MTEPNLQSRELDRAEWPLFFDRLSRQFEGRMVSIELGGDYRSVRTMARHMPLMGVTVEQDGKDELVIEILVGDSTEACISHTVVGPEHVVVLQPLNGEDRQIEIRSADGSRLLITLENSGAAAGHMTQPFQGTAGTEGDASAGPSQGAQP